MQEKLRESGQPEHENCEKLIENVINIVFADECSIMSKTMLSFDNMLDLNDNRSNFIFSDPQINSQTYNNSLFGARIHFPNGYSEQMYSNTQHNHSQNYNNPTQMYINHYNSYMADSYSQFNFPQHQVQTHTHENDKLNFHNEFYQNQAIPKQMNYNYYNNDVAFSNNNQNYIQFNNNNNNNSYTNYFPRNNKNYSTTTNNGSSEGNFVLILLEKLPCTSYPSNQNHSNFKLRSNDVISKSSNSQNSKLLNYCSAIVSKLRNE